MGIIPLIPFMGIPYTMRISWYYGDNTYDTPLRKSMVLLSSWYQYPRIIIMGISCHTMGTIIIL